MHLAVDIAVEPLTLPESEEPWIDVTVPVRDGMVHWPGNPEIHITQTEHLQRGDEATVSSLSFGAHTGTHVDAPVHFIVDGTGVDAIRLDRLIGPARVLDLGEVDRIRQSDIETRDIRAGDRILFKTRNSRYWGEKSFRRDYTGLVPAAAAWLAGQGVWTVGIDYLSIADMGALVETHQRLLGAGVCIIEGLDLSRVGPGLYDLICLPLRLEGLDGAPARALLRKSRLMISESRSGERRSS